MCVMQLFYSITSIPPMFDIILQILKFIVIVYIILYKVILGHWLVITDCQIKEDVKL